MFPKINLAPKVYKKVFPEFVYKMKFNGLHDINTGLSGCGAIIYKNNKEIWSSGFCIEDNITNDHAEYVGLIYGLQKAYTLNISHLIVEGNNQVIINHMRGLYTCETENLIELYCRAKEIESNFDYICFNHIYNIDNKVANKLSMTAIQNYLASLKSK
jgi:ribonuclease HI